MIQYANLYLFVKNFHSSLDTMTIFCLISYFLIKTVTKLYFFYQQIGLEYTFLIFMLWIWITSVVRDTSKHLAILGYYHLFAFLTFSTEELVLFVGFFWISNHLALSPWCDFFEGMIYSGSNDSIAITLILSNAATQLSVLIILILIGSKNPIYGVTVLASSFIIIHVNETRELLTHFNQDWNISLLVTGVHYTHVMFGFIFVSVFSQPFKIRNFSYKNVTNNIPEIVLFYWHLVESLWIGILINLF